jgi:hypothetical protein
LMKGHEVKFFSASNDRVYTKQIHVFINHQPKLINDHSNNINLTICITSLLILL